MIRNLPFGLWLWFLANGTAAASAPVQLEVQAGASFLDFGYQEFADNGALLDREDGRIPGFVARLAGSSRVWTLAGELSHHAGDVDYRGKTNTGGAVSTITDETITNLAVTLGRRFGRCAWRDSRIYVGIGYNDWHRDIRPTQTAAGQPVAGLVEDYVWWSGFAGAAFDFLASPGMRFGADARVIRIIDPQLEIDFGGLFDDASLDLGEDWGMRIALPARFRIKAASWLVVEPWYERWEFGRSRDTSLTQNGSPAGTVFEPASETENIGVNLTLTWEW
jgi:hypothetical protein